MASEDQLPAPLKIMILAGEASGDAYGAQLVRALFAENQRLEIRAWGGEAMESAGARVIRHYNTLSFMGFWEVLKHLGTIQALFRECEEELDSFAPDIWVGIDYPGFNLRMARRAKAKGIETHHYISPSVWAWNKRRIRGMQKNIEHLHVILPFEEKWYAEHDMKVHYVGHPLLEIPPFSSSGAANDVSYSTSQQPLLLLMPGSRKQEIQHLLPTMIEAAQGMEGFRAIVAGAPGRTEDDYDVAEKVGIPIVFGKTHALMQEAAVALITSGTATLEAALLGLPHLICYKTSWLTYFLAKKLTNTDWIGLPNILSGEEIVPEFIQSDCASEALQDGLKNLHNGRIFLEEANRQKAAFHEIRRELVGPEQASVQVARAVLS